MRDPHMCTSVTHLFLLDDSDELSASLQNPSRRKIVESTQEGVLSSHAKVRCCAVSHSTDSLIDRLTAHS